MWKLVFFHPLFGVKTTFIGACGGPSLTKKRGGTKPTLLSLLRYKSEKVYRESFELRVSECGRPTSSSTPICGGLEVQFIFLDRAGHKLQFKV